jgi:hypothetical protein
MLDTVTPALNVANLDLDLDLVLAPLPAISARPPVAAETSLAYAARSGHYHAGVGSAMILLRRDIKIAQISADPKEMMQNMIDAYNRLADVLSTAATAADILANKISAGEYR